MKEMLEKYWKEFKVGTKLMFKEFFNKETNKKQRANMWTFTRLVLPVITAITSTIAIITASTPLFITTACIAGFGALTDKFDGLSAKNNNSYSQYGKVLDQVTDKSFAGIIGINLLFLNFNYIFVLLGELAIAATNITYKLKHKNLNINSTLTGRIKQIPLFSSLVLGFLSTINPSLLLISNISIILTILFQLATVSSYIKSNNESVKELKKEDIQNYIEEFEENFEKNKEKIKTKSIDAKNTNVIEKNKNISKLEQYENLINFKNDLTENEINNGIEEEKGYQKTKK